MTLIDPPLTESTLYIIAAVAVGTAATTLWITREFGKNRKIFYDGLRALRFDFYRIISEHNKEDDDRFEAIVNEQWEARLREAVRFGETPAPRKVFPRRRYLDEAIARGGPLGEFGVAQAADDG